MSIFFMFGKYTTAAVQDINPERTEKSIELIKKHGGALKSMYALLGEHDLILITDFPTMENAMAASVALQKLTGISFSTSPVVDVNKFDRLIEKTKEI